MTSERSFAEWIRVAQEHGWTVRTTGAGHLRWTPPEGPFVISPGSTKNFRAVRNLRARLRRAGLPL